MSKLPKQLTRVVDAWNGDDYVSPCRYRAYWCEECKRYRLWPGPDWGESHYFCDDCLAKLELSQDETPRAAEEAL